MTRNRVTLPDKMQAEVIDKARAKHNRRDATRKAKEPATPAAPGAETVGVAETIRDMAEGAVAKVEEMMNTASKKIKDMVEGPPHVSVGNKKNSRRAKSKA
jgi:hypothetical protein